MQRCRRLSFLRLLALCVLALGVVAQSSIAAIGDVHELSHSVTLHAHADTHAKSGDGNEPDENAELQHALMHAGHCCGHLIAMPIMATWTPTARPGHVPASFSAAVASRRVDNPLRPPIVN